MVMASQASTDLHGVELLLTDLDEHALLADVETLLNSEIFLTSEFSDVERSSTGSENETSRSKGAWKHYIYRQRQRNERDTLRLQERELTQLLAQTKASKTYKPTTQATSYYLAKAVATRQDEERICAEAEHKSLILTVSVQAKRIEAISSVFRKRLDQLQVVSRQNDTNLKEYQELKNYVETLIESIGWIGIKHSTLRSVCATLTASYGLAKKTIEATSKIGEENAINQKNECNRKTAPVSSTLAGPSARKSRVGKKVRATTASRYLTYKKNQETERDSLKRQVKELTTQLKMLTKQTAARGKGDLGIVAWKALANRQLEARLQVEGEYRQLYQEVEKRSALIENIGMIFRKREHVDVVGGVYRSPKRFRVKTPDITLYEMYLKQLDEIYAQTDSIFSEITVEASRTSNFYKESRPTSSKYRDLVGTEIAPFPFARVRQIVCRCQCMIKRPGSEKYDGPEISDSTTAVKVCIAGPKSGDSISSLVQLAMMRRYDEDSRLVNVWKKCTEGEGAFAGMHCEETGWCVVRPTLDGNTIMESIVRYTPLIFSTADDSNARLKQFIKAVFNVREEDCKSCGRDLERKMLNISY